MTDISINIADAAPTLAKLVDQFCSFEVDYNDIPADPDSLDDKALAILRQAVDLAQNGDEKRAYEIATTYSGGSFEFDYLRGKILFSHKSYFEAEQAFGDAIIKFDGYGEAWFYLGIANYQMGLLGEASINWEEAGVANKNHEDAKALAGLANTVIEHTEKHFNQNVQPLLPIVADSGIEIGDKVFAEATAVDSGDLGALADGKLDYVIASNILELSEDPLKTLLEFGRVLKQGGVIGLVVPDDDAYDTIHADEKRLHVFTRASLRNMVSIIPGLEIVDMGTGVNRHSFYAILEKVANGSKPVYPYKRKAREALAKTVAKRAEMALLTGLNDIAAAACRKLDLLTPGVSLPADPDALHPFPFANMQPQVQAMSGESLKVAVLDNGKCAADLARSLLQSGVSVTTVYFENKQKITWPIEKRLREIDPDFVITCNLNPYLSDQLANMNIPYVCWVKEVSTKDILWRRDLMTDNTHIFHFSQNEVKRYKRLGVDNIVYLPLAADAKSFEPPYGKPEYERDINIVEEMDPVNGYTDITLALRRSLMNAKTPIAEKNKIFQWMRKFGAVIDRSVDLATKWSVPTVWKEVVNGTDFSELELSDTEICFAIGDEVSSRHRKIIERELIAPNVTVETSVDPKNYASSKINLYLNKAYNRDGAPSEIFNVMARGGFLMTDHRDVYNELFEIGKDLVCFTSIEEAREMVEHYLNHAEEREAIAENGRQKVMEHHTFKQRWETILETLRGHGVIDKT